MGESDAQNLSLKTAAKEGVYNAVSDTVKYSVIGGIAIAFIYMIGEKRIKKISKKVRSL